MLAPLMAIPICHPAVEATEVSTLEPSVVAAVVFNCIVVPTHCARTSVHGTAPPKMIEQTSSSARVYFMVVLFRLKNARGVSQVLLGAGNGLKIKVLK
jgi:hypothetical protein